MQHGIFYEEINHAGDGGLNAELIRNGNFADGRNGWALDDTSAPDAALSFKGGGSDGRNELVISGGKKPGSFALASNSGHFGIGMVKGAEYVLSLDARA